MDDAITQPVAWRVKDFADGWILLQDEAAVKKETEHTGNLIEPLFVQRSSEVVLLREIIINLTNAAAIVLSEMEETNDTRRGYDLLESEVKQALEKAGIKEGDLP